MSQLRHFLNWKLGLASASTQTTIAERDTLASYAAGKQCVVEVGVWHGVTSCRLLEAMNGDGRFYAVDPYPPGRLGVSFARAIARREVRPFSRNRVRWLPLTGADAAQTLSATEAGNVDFLFLDGDHSYEGLRSDWESWSPLIAPSGIVALHDSRPTPTRPIHEAGSVRYTRDVIVRDGRFQIVEEVDSLTVLQRRN